MPFIRKATALVVLATIGLPACFGVALHWGQSDCCAGERASVCGSNCPLDHDDQPVDRMVSLDECLICEFLAIAKQVDPTETPVAAMDRLPECACVHEMAPFTDNGSISFLARGPPATRNI
jgi:uncharacterized membrane protein